MSDDFHRPTYTSTKTSPNGDIAPTNEDGYYNPTQVRLYGIPAQPGKILADESITLSIYKTRAKIEIALDQLDGWGGDDDEIWTAHLKDRIKIARAFLAQLRVDQDDSIFENFKYAGLPWPVRLGNEFRAALDTKQAGSVSLYAGQTATGAKDADPAQISSGVMFGYAYEGHTYDFAKPKLMIVPTLPLTKIPADDSGYDLKETEGYKVWIVDKLEQCVEIQVDRGFIEQIVLDANLPSKRSPTMYNAKMALAHRGS